MIKRILRDIHYSIKNDTLIINNLECFRYKCKTSKGDFIRAEFQCVLDVGNRDVLLYVGGNRIEVRTKAKSSEINIGFFSNRTYDCGIFDTPMQIDMIIEDYKIIKKKTEDFRSDIKKYMTEFFKSPKH